MEGAVWSDGRRPGVTTAETDSGDADQGGDETRACGTAPIIKELQTQEVGEGQDGEPSEDVNSCSRYRIRSSRKMRQPMMMATRFSRGADAYSFEETEEDIDVATDGGAYGVFEEN